VDEGIAGLKSAHKPSQGFYAWVVTFVLSLGMGRSHLYYNHNMGQALNRLNAKPEVDDVTVLHYVFLTLQTQKALLFGCGKGAAVH